MKQHGTVMAIYESIIVYIGSYDFLVDARLKATAFSRRRKLCFTDTILCMLNFFTKGSQVEVTNYFSQVKNSVQLSKQAFIKARQNIRYQAFILLNDHIIDKLYNQLNFKTFFGYRLLAIDGTYITLHNTHEMQREFGYTDNKVMKHAQAQASALYDVENDMILHSLIDCYTTNERFMALAHLGFLSRLGLRNDLLLFDRGYPSRELIADLTERKIKFVMRVSTAFLKTIMEANAPDSIVTIYHGGKRIKIRVLNILLKNGTKEKLITNILDENRAPDFFKTVYAKRWGIEGCYDILKNRLQLENFSGNDALTVRQDFFATVFLSNMVALARLVPDEILAQKTIDKGLKYVYKSNYNIVLSTLKNKLMILLLLDDPRARSAMFDEFVISLQVDSQAIRPGRSFDRKKTGSATKFPMNQKAGC